MTEDIVGDTLAAIARADWDTVKANVHPYVHWNGMRGRTNVLAHLACTPAPDAPSSVELRDGQIYRWSD